MSEIIHNKRKAKCADCRRALAPGEGVQHEMGWFGGNGNSYYLCQACDRKRAMDKEEKAAGVIYE